MYKKYFDGKKAVLFDLDGTLIDSEGLWDEAINSILEAIDAGWAAVPLEAGTYMVDKWRAILDRSNIKTPLTAEELTKKTQNEFMQRFIKSDIGVREGFWSLAFELKEEKGFKLGITSNTDREVVNQVLSHLDITPVFDLVIAGDEVKRKKPNPEIYMTAAAKLGVTPKEILVFEDSAAGARAADKAGMDVIVIWNGETSKYAYPEKIKEFSPDFSSFPGNLDTTFLDILKNAVEQQVKERKGEKAVNPVER